MRSAAAISGSARTVEPVRTAIVAGLAGLGLLLSGASVSVAQTVDTPRTAWNVPDFSGYWEYRTSTPLQRPATLHGCRLLPDGDRCLIVREARGLEVRHGVAGGDPVFWDGRFRLRVADVGRDISIGPLDPSAWSTVAQACPQAAAAVPVAARASLPALYDITGLLSVPHLGYNRETEGMPPGPSAVSEVRFIPRRSAGALGFRLARGRTRTM